MPSIKDQTTVKAIAREYCSNGRNKAKAMQTIGYADSSCKSGQAVGDVYGNLRVIEAIKAIDDKTGAESEMSRELLVKNMQDIMDDETSSKADRTRAASLIADMCGYKRENAPNKEMELAIKQRMSAEDLELAQIAAQVRTEQEARRGIKIA